MTDLEGMSRASTVVLPAATAEKQIRLQLIPWSTVPMSKPILSELVERRVREGQSFKIGRQVQREALKPGEVYEFEEPNLLDVWLNSKVVSRSHAQITVKDNSLLLKDLGSSSGTFLNKLRLSPTTKPSKDFPIKEGDVIQFGVDYKGKPDDIYKSITVRVGFYDQSWVHERRKKADETKFRTALINLLNSTNPNSDQKDETEIPECCVCIGETGPFQALFIAPCSHVYHYKCVASIIVQSAMFQCPMCRQVANLTASVSAENLNAIVDVNAEISVGAKGDPKKLIPLPSPEGEAAPKEKKRRGSSLSQRISTFLGRRTMSSGAASPSPTHAVVEDQNVPVVESPLSNTTGPSPSTPVPEIIEDVCIAGQSPPASNAGSSPAVNTSQEVNANVFENEEEEVEESYVVGGNSLNVNTSNIPRSTTINTFDDQYEIDAAQLLANRITAVPIIGEEVM